MNAAGLWILRMRASFGRLGHGGGGDKEGVMKCIQLDAAWLVFLVVFF